MVIFVGTYSEASDPESIHTVAMDRDTGALELRSSIGGIVNPSYLALHPGGRFLYAVNEVARFRGRDGGGVSAFEIDPETGGLALLNQQPIAGRGPCHIALSEGGEYAVVSNYGDGSVAVLPLREGRLQGQSDFVSHRGSSVHPRQTSPHAHQAVFDPSNRFVLVNDLGLDRVILYRLDRDEGLLSEVRRVEIEPGSGPRHLSFHPSGRWVYLLNELKNTIHVFSFEEDSGSMKLLQKISTLPAAYADRSHAADIHVHPSGEFLYASNRGHDSIAALQIDEAGLLEVLEHEPTGEGPRSFAVDPAGEWLVVAHQRSNTLMSLRVDRTTGGLEGSEHSLHLDQPVCVKFQEAPNR